MQNNRIAYIDALRGFTMFLVVLQHVETYGIRCLGSGTFVETFLLPFRMPLFFFISGFVTYKGIERFTLKFTSEMALKKLVHLIVPLVVFCFLYSQVTSMKQTIFDGSELLGYWFTLVLLEMALLYFVFSLISRLTNQWVLDIALVVTSIVLYIFMMDIPYNNTNNVLCLRKLAHYFQFFAFGILCKRHGKMFTLLVTNNIAIAIAIVLYFACMYMMRFNVFSGNVLTSIFQVLIPFSGLIAIVSLFHNNEQYFAANGRISRAMQYVGTRTLDIYMLHYFLLPNVAFLKPYIVNNSNAVLEFVVVGAIALCVIGVCLLLSAVIRNSQFLGHFLFAAKTEKYKF